MSVFWRASVRRWRHFDVGVGIRLGKYEEPLRKWLMDEGPFPKNMSIMICLPPHAQALPMFYGPRAVKTAHFHRFTFYVPGVELILFVGNRMPEHAISSCAYNTPEKLVFSSPDVIKNAKAAYRDLKEEDHRASRKLQISLKEFRARRR
jgi:hypothetical protein